MSLIEQARELVQGMVSADAEPDRSDHAAVPDLPLDRSDAERIRQEWNAQPHHP